MFINVGECNTYHTIKFRYSYINVHSASNNALKCWGRSTKKSACFPLSIHPLCTTAFFPERVHCILVFLIWEHITPLQRWVFNSIWPCAHCSTPTHTLILNTHTSLSVGSQTAYIITFVGGNSIQTLKYCIIQYITAWLAGKPAPFSWSLHSLWHAALDVHHSDIPSMFSDF